MPAWLLLLLVALGLYGLFLLALVLLGRREQAVAWARLVPDCLVLAKRLLGDPRVPPSRKVLLGGLIVYLAMPFDLVPDFVPVAGVLDDAVLVALVLRSVARAAGPELLAEHWPGPPASLALIERLATSPR
jgi:uncharacterized membrane protein YkvA (DUF1232 family)